MASKILFATGNRHKLEEANQVLSPYGISLAMAGCEKLEIQAGTLEEVASFAAKAAALSVGASVLVEDSGLFIDALGGFPGPYSSYAFKTIGCSGVLRLMEGISNRAASFRCAVAYCAVGAEPKVFTGVSEGSICTSMKGSGGFGFDPIFVGKGGSMTYAELGTESKCKLSHRGEAFRRFSEWFLSSAAPGKSGRK